MEFKTYEFKGRRLMAEFTCQRCGEKTYRWVKDCIDEYHGKGTSPASLSDLNPPGDWCKGTSYAPVLCPKCKNALEEFMSMKIRLPGE